MGAFTNTTACAMPAPSGACTRPVTVAAPAPGDAHALTAATSASNPLECLGMFMG
jgi:hypothetical protein